MQQDGADGRTYRLLRTSQEQRDDWTLQQRDDAQWEAQYRFTLQPHDLADFTERCQYQQTSPESHFTQKRICSLATLTGRITLSDMHLITTRHGERKEQMLTSQEEYVAALAEHFGIVLL